MMSLRKTIDHILLVLIFIYIVYSFWYQYGIAPVSGLLSFIGMLMLLCSIAIIHLEFDYYKEVILVGFFVLYCLLSLFLVSDNTDLSIKLVIHVAKYCIPLFAIYQYVGKEEKKFNNVVLSVLCGCAILAVWSFFKPIYNMTYTNVKVIEEGNLNANEFSSYMMMGAMSSTFLLRKEQGLKKILLYALLAIMLMAQLNAASRRGILIYIFLIVAYLHSIITIKYKKNILKKLFSILLLLAVGCVIVIDFSKLADKYIGIQRILGLYTGGDSLRRYYSRVAVELFRESPILGKGLGAVTNRIGMYSHSLYYELIACTGVVGTALIIAYLVHFLVFFGKNSIKTNDVLEDKKLTARLLFWYVVALLICGVAVVMIYDSYYYILLAVFASAVNVIKGKDWQSGGLIIGEKNND